MSLKETMADERLAAELLESQKKLYSGMSGAALLVTLKSKFPGISNAHLLQWLPEQGEDIFWILVNSKAVAVIEIPRSGNEQATCKLISIEEYLSRRLTRDARRKVKMAIKLISRQDNQSQG